MIGYKTTWVPSDTTTDKWYICDAKGATLGRLASNIATLILGKRLATFSSGAVPRIFLVVINADKVVLSGRKAEQKVYYSHSGYMGGLKKIPYKMMLEKHPTRILNKAVWGMLPKNRLGRKVLKHLKIYAGEEHNHHSQQPELITFNGVVK